MTDEPRYIPFLEPELPDFALVSEDFAKICASGVFSNGGQFDAALSREVSAYLGVRDCVPVANATLGLMLAIETLARRDGGRKVLLPAFTFPAAALAVEWAGFEPLFCDIDASSWQPTVPAGLLAQRREEIALIVLCNTFGAPADIDTWNDAADGCGIPMLVDSASGLGGTYVDGRRFGQAGCVEVFSMHATKAFAVGEGGLVVADAPAIAQSIRRLRNFGFDEQRRCTGLGINAKLSEFHAAIACRVLERYDQILAQRREIAAAYRRRLEPYGYVFQRHGERSPYQAVPVRIPDGVSRGELRRHLKTAGIETAQYFSMPLQQHPRYERCETVDALAVTNRVARSILSLPMSNHLSAADVERVCAAVIEHTSRPTPHRVSGIGPDE